MNNTIRMATVVALQALILAGLVGRNYYTWVSGWEDPVRIAMGEQRPDPEDFKAGNKVRLDLSINKIDMGLITLDPDDEFKRGATVYVVLERTSQAWNARAVYRSMPFLDGGQRVISGRVEYIDDGPGPGEVLVVNYGVESFVVRPDSAQTYPSWRRDRDLSVQVRLDRSGRALLEGIFAQGVLHPSRCFFFCPDLLETDDDFYFEN